MASTSLLAPSAQAQQPSDTVTAIEVRGNQRIEQATIENYLSLRQGDRFDDRRLDDSLKTLFATGLFDDVRIEREGSVLVVTVVENPIINRVAFEGNDRITTEVLTQEVQLQPRTVFTRARVQAAVTRILDIYRSSGRYGATVEPKVIELDQNRVDLVFEIKEGPLTGVGGISFIGNENFSDSALRGVIQTKESAWYRFFTTDDTYDPDRLAYDQELLRRFYTSRGYAQFEVRSAVAELSPDGSDFFITFTVDEGELFNFGDITVTSNVRDVQPEELQSLLVPVAGETYSSEQIEKTVEALTDRLSVLGYAFTRVNPVQQIDTENKTVAVNFVVDEGPRVYVERIDIRGNVRTLDRVIRREFRLAEGDAFNADLLRRSEQRIRALGFFDRVEVGTQQGSAADKVVITVDVVERSTGELSFGAGYSTSDGVLGDIRLRERNLLGRGQDIDAQFTFSGRRQDIGVGFTEPYFMDRDLAVGFDLFSRETDYQDESSFDERNVGGTVRANYPLTENWRHGVRYTLRNDKIFDVPDDSSPYIRDEEGDRTSSIIGQTLAYDTRDDRFLPNAGTLLRLDQDIAGLGGDNQWIKHEVRSDWYYSIIPDVVVNLGVSAGYIVGFGGEEVHLSDRFFIGGASFRGFEFAGIGPRDVDFGDALGGNLYYVGTAEMRFPLGLPEELQIFGRSFAQAGTLTDIDLSGPGLEDSGSLRASAGVGLSWISPLGPLAIDFALPFAKEDYDETEEFRISFGTRF
ncbi:MAG TPA: outer membrane protein assembly factor BamA [Geminicoccus sp.]|uniref:outer membrane protein assembly factor BamA n=1 Tax=Geminicoccus sp. TaxID=2024832 RepID=UPI002E37B4AB|nr:outer membrane protein assembly factor BamA [Geminicoccus sp.]HEX2527658.1 outer membrane protein assembly factor BamA [Geminicoccus sp.]